jgi:lipoprotein-releasing system permease protein
MNNFRLIIDITKVHLMSRLKQSSIAALGVTFGIGTFIILVSFMTGLNGLLDGLILNRTPHIRMYNELKPSEVQPVQLSEEYKNTFNLIHSVKPKSNQSRIHNALPILSNLKNDTRVKGATPQAVAKVFYLAGSIDLNGVVNGIDVAEEMRLFNFENYIIEGNAMDLIKINNGILIGSGIASKMSLQLGDKIQVSSVQGGSIPLKIVGIYQSGLAELDNIQSFVTLQTAQQLLNEGQHYISDIHIKLWNIEEAPFMAKELSRKHDVSATDIQTANAQFETGTNIRNLITYAVSITLLIVAGFGIYNILNMLIYEKMDDIAILKATGFTGNDVKLIFISQSMIIGFIGGILGLVFGFGVSVLIDHTPFETAALPSIKTYPVNFNIIYYLIGIFFALISTFLAGYYPSRKAQRIDPVDIIRGK